MNRTVKDFVQDAGSRPGGNCQVVGSRARQLAMTVIYLSPQLCLADSPKSYLGQPGVEFFRGLPTVWDETVVPFGRRLPAPGGRPPFGQELVSGGHERGIAAHVIGAALFPRRRRLYDPAPLPTRRSPARGRRPSPKAHAR